MKERTATVLGATGLTGGHLAALLAEDPYFTTVRIVVRKAPESVAPGIKVIVIDFSDQLAFRSAIEGSDAVFCAVGTTRKKVNGDMIAYRKVDYDIPVDAARHCLATGCGSFLMVSSVGASSASSNYYLRFKGEAEEAIAAMGIPSVSVFRPSMLLGERKEFRFGEEVSRLLSYPVSFLFPSKYKPIKAYEVAKAMAAAARNDEKGLKIYHYTQIKLLAAK